MESWKFLIFKEALTRAQGTVGSVLKKRTLYIYKQDGTSTRVHMDEVDGLGDFIEFEVFGQNILGYVTLF